MNKPSSCYELISKVLVKTLTVYILLNAQDWHQKKIKAPRLRFVTVHAPSMSMLEAKSLFVLMETETPKAGCIRIPSGVWWHSDPKNYSNHNTRLAISVIKKMAINREVNICRKTTCFWSLQSEYIRSTAECQQSIFYANKHKLPYFSNLAVLVVALRAQGGLGSEPTPQKQLWHV